MTLGDNIKAIRKQKKMTQEELAGNMGISRSYLGDLENNRRNPSSETLNKLATKLDVNLNYLISGESTDYLSYLLEKLSNQLFETEKNIPKKFFPIMLEQIKYNVLFSLKDGDKNISSIEKNFYENKSQIINHWRNEENFDTAVLSILEKNISDNILEYTEFINSSQKNNMLYKLEDINRIYIDCLRFIDNDYVASKLEEAHNILLEFKH